MQTIRLDAADAGSQMNDDGRISILDGTLNVFSVSKVVILRFVA